MNHRAVIFSKHGTRIIHCQDVAPYLNRSDALVDPATSHVEGVPRHYWKKEGLLVQEMTDAEKRDRDEHLARVNPSNVVFSDKKHRIVHENHKLLNMSRLAVLMATIAIVLSLIGMMGHK